MEKARKINRILWAITGTVLVAVSCAKQGSITGGPKDVDPPVVVKTKPPEYSVNFIPEKKIVITFDEYIQANNIFQELIISPPLEGNLTTQIQGKNLIIQLPADELYDTATYTIDFGNSIEDVNEGNAIHDFRYVFSLKSYIDSLNVEGSLINAFDHKPDKERMLVMLYSNLNDSAPYLEKPSYISRSDESGNFSLHNIGEGKYRLFALKDANFNLIYDLATEPVAFYDSVIDLSAGRFHNNIVLDTITDNITDNISTEIDSITSDTAFREAGYFAGIDSLGKDSFQNYYSFNVQLFFFTPEIKNQYLSDYLRPEKEQLLFIFNQTLAEDLVVTPLNYETHSSGWYLPDISRNADTVRYWITDTAMVSLDTLIVEACYPVFDSLLNLYEKADTLRMIVPKKKEKRARMSKRGEEIQEYSQTELPRLSISNNVKNRGAFDLNQHIELISSRPLAKSSLEKIKVFRVQDTLEIPVKIDVSEDTGSYYKTIIKYAPESKTTYIVFFPDSTFIDIYGSTNDTTQFRYTTQSDDYYGALTMHLKGVEKPLILQLLDDKEVVLKENRISSDIDIRYDYLHPKSYILKIIVDENDNGKWDTGDYIKGIQPERVIYYPQKIDIRANWEIEYNWDF